MLANEILGPAFDYDFLPATGAAGGILLAWVRDDWVVSDINKGRFAISARFQKRGATSTPWWLTGVYGPQEDAQKVEFLAELRQFRDTSPGPRLICDTFTWRLTADRSYSAASVYGAMFLGSSPVLGAKQIWKTPAPPKVRFFFWLTMHGAAGLVIAASATACNPPTIASWVIKNLKRWITF